MQNEGLQANMKLKLKEGNRNSMKFMNVQYQSCQYIFANFKEFPEVSLFFQDFPGVR